MYVFYTKLTVEECKMKLNAFLEKNSSIFGLFHGIVNFNKNTFYLLKKSNYRNSFARCFYGKLKDGGQRTEIEGCFRLPVGVKIFMTAWFVILFAIFLPLLISFLSSGGGSRPLMPLLFPAAMAAAAVLLMWAGIKLNIKNEQYILELLKTELNIEE